jgi:hypothetical protein
MNVVASTSTFVLHACCGWRGAASTARPCSTCMCVQFCFPRPASCLSLADQRKSVQRPTTTMHMSCFNLRLSASCGMVWRGAALPCSTCMCVQACFPCRAWCLSLADQRKSVQRPTTTMHMSCFNLRLSASCGMVWRGATWPCSTCMRFLHICACRPASHGLIRISHLLMRQRGSTA